MLGGAGAVVGARQQHQLGGVPGLLEGIDEHDAVLGMHIVVQGAVQQQQAPAELGGGLQHGAGGIALLVIGGQAHVALGVDAVVEAPIRHGSAGDAQLPALAVGEGVGDHEPAVAPALQAEAVHVRPALGLQPGVAVQQVLQLLGAQVAVDAGGAGRALARGAAVVADPGGDAVLGQELVPGHLPAPGVPHGGGAGAAVGVLEDRVLAGGVEVHREHQQGLHGEAVPGLHLLEADAAPLEGLPLGGRVGVDEAQRLARGAMEGLAGRGLEVAPGVEELGVGGIEAHPVGAGLGGQAGEALAIQADAIGVQADGAALGGIEEQLPGRSHAMDLAHVPGACGDRGEGLAVPVVAVDMVVPRAAGLPQEAAIRQPEGQGQTLLPGLATFPDQNLGAGAFVGPQLQPALDAVLQGRQQPSLGVPAHLDDEGLLVGVGVLHPGGLPGQVHHAQAGRGVGVAGLGVAGLEGLLRLAAVIQEGEDRDLGLVQAEVGQAAGVRGPPVGPEAAPAIDLLLVDPVQAAVEDGLAAPLSEAGLGARGDFLAVEVVAPEEGHLGPVRAEGGLVGLGLAEAAGRGGGGLHQVEGVRHVHQEGRAGFIPHEAAPAQGGLGLGNGGARRLQGLLQARGVQEGLGLPGAGVHPGENGLLPVPAGLEQSPVR